jgi:hypothetical protein
MLITRMSQNLSLNGISILTYEAVLREVEKENARKRELAKQQSCWTKFKNWFPLTKPRIILNPTQRG